MKDTLLMIFVKNLIPGMVKTRLAKDIGIDKALDVYQELIYHTHDITRKLPYQKAVYYSEYVEIEDVWEDDNFDHKVQKGAELGEKMRNAFDEAFDAHHFVGIIGSDCYELTQAHLQTAFEMLEEHDLVIGPAKDGGYYFLGMKEFYPQLFENKEYSNGNVLLDLLGEAEKLHLVTYQLPTLTDIDTLEDLQKTDIDWQNLGEEDVEEDQL